MADDSTHPCERNAGCDIAGASWRIVETHVRQGRYTVMLRVHTRISFQNMSTPENGCFRPHVRVFLGAHKHTPICANIVNAFGDTCGEPGHRAFCFTECRIHSLMM